MRVTEDLKLNSQQADVISDVQRALARCEEAGVAFRPIAVEIDGVLRAALVRESTEHSIYKDYILRGAVE